MLTLFIGLFAIINNRTGMYLSLINGTGKIYIQTIYALISMIMIIPITYYIVKILNLGVTGFGLSLFMMNIVGVFLTHIQYKKIINHKDYGVWGR
jgi:Na+-driven multidrug efflux pump